MNFLPRFSRLMAEALHYGSAPEGLALPLPEVHERLKALADEERNRPLPTVESAASESPSLLLPEAAGAPDEAARRLRLACENARFAVYAWVDEQILQSARLDAADWLSYSLQYHYCETTAAGRDFFARLKAVVQAAVPPSGDAPSPSPDEEDMDDIPWALEAFVLHGGDELATATVQTYALCLLYGFSGMLREYPEILSRCRKAACALLLRDAPPEVSPLPPPRAATPFIAAALEKALYILLPPVIVLLFGALCAAALADLPLPRF